MRNASKDFWQHRVTKKPEQKCSVHRWHWCKNNQQPIRKQQLCPAKKSTCSSSAATIEQMGPPPRQCGRWRLLADGRTSVPEWSGLFRRHRLGIRSIRCCGSVSVKRRVPHQYRRRLNRPMLILYASHIFSFDAGLIPSAHCLFQRWVASEDLWHCCCIGIFSICTYALNRIVYCRGVQVQNRCTENEHSSNMYQIYPPTQYQAQAGGRVVTSRNI